MRVYLLLPVIMLAVQPSAAMNLDPLLPHAHGQHPAVAAARLAAESPHLYNTVFTPNIASYAGYSTATEVETMLTARAYSLCVFDGWFVSDGIIGVGGDYYDVQVGTIRRTPYRQGKAVETFACTSDGKLLWSGTCANPIKSQDGIATVIEVQASVQPACTPVVREHNVKHVDHVPGISVGNISIGSETTVVASTYYTYTCE